jgi:alpha-mannosidase
VVSNRVHGGKLPFAGGTLLNVEGDVRISAIKTPENPNEKNKGYLIIRLYDISDKPQKITLTLPAEPTEAVTLDTVEVVKDNPAVTNLKIKGKTITFTLSKSASATIRAKI